MYSISFRSSALMVALLLAVTAHPSSLLAQVGTAANGVDAGAPSSIVATPALVAASNPLSTAGPRVAPAGIVKPVQANPLGLVEQGNQDEHMGVGSNLALIGAGAAGVVLGILIGGNGGTALAVGGGVVGLVGLYRFLR